MGEKRERHVFGTAAHLFYDLTVCFSCRRVNSTGVLGYFFFFFAVVINTSSRIIPATFFVEIRSD